ncbi:MAG: MalM family protein [Gammaproteobacteria bacterium]|nr:MalM family protein [Gammaproteobacteria bacterium]
MMSRIFFLTLLFYITFSPAYGAVDYSQFSYTPLDIGHQGRLPSEIQFIKDGELSQAAYFYQLPRYEKKHRIIINSLVKKKQVFFPKILLLSENFDVLAELNNQPKISSSLTHGFSIGYKFEITPAYRYIVLVADQAYLGKNIRHTYKVARMYPLVPLYMNLLLPAKTYVLNAEIVDHGQFVFFLPYEKNYAPAIKPHAPSFGVFTGFGQNQLFVSNEMTPYSAGDAAIAQLGYRNRLFNFADWSYRADIGYKFFNSDVEVSAINLQTYLIYELFNFSNIGVELGAGVNLDLNHRVTDVNDENLLIYYYEETTPRKLQFKNAIGPAVFLGFQYEGALEMKLHYMKMNYKTNNGLSFDGSHAGISINIHFGI